MFTVASFALPVSQANPSSSTALTDSLSAVVDTPATLPGASDSLAAVGAAVSAAPGEETAGAFTSIVDSLPTDPASLFALLLLVGCTVLVLRYGLQKGGSGKQASNPSERSSSSDSTR